MPNFLNFFLPCDIKCVYVCLLSHQLKKLLFFQSLWHEITKTKPFKRQLATYPGCSRFCSRQAKIHLSLFQLLKLSVPAYESARRHIAYQTVFAKPERERDGFWLKSLLDLKRKTHQKGLVKIKRFTTYPGCLRSCSR